MSDTNKTFKADSTSKEPYSYVSAELDLTQLPVGTYYFNSENNFEYSKNWFNYNKFATIPENAIIKEVVQYGSPEIVPNDLDTSKDYVLDSTSLDANWKAKIISSGLGIVNIASDTVSTTDLTGNVYVCGVYENGSLDLYDSTNINVTSIPLGFSIPPPPIPTSDHSFMAKYTPAGGYLWKIRLIPAEQGTYIKILDVKTDIFKNVYVCGCYYYNSPVPVTSSGGMIILNSDGNQYFCPPDPSSMIPLAISIPNARSGIDASTSDGFLIKYDSNGFVIWATRFQNINPLDSSIAFPIDRFSMSMEVDSTSNVYITTQYGYANCIAYDTPGYVSNIPVLPQANNPTNAFLLKYNSQGIAIWMSRIDGDNHSGYGRAMTIDNFSNIYFTGYYNTIENIYDASGLVSSVTPPPSSKSGIDWVLRETNQNWKCIASNGSGDRLVAVVYGGQIYTSVDGGATWIQRETNRNWISVASDNSGLNLIAAVYGGQIYVSNDGGLNWIPKDTNRNWISVSVSSTGQYMVAAVEGQKIYSSIDFGISFNPYISPVGSFNWKSVAIDSSGSNIVAVTSLASKIYISINGGLNFNVIANSPIQTWSGIAISPDGSVIVAIVNGGYIYQSSDGGVNWNTRYFAEVQEWNYIYCNNNGPATSGNFIASVDSGLLYLSTDKGISWNPTNSIRLWTSVTSNADFSKLCGTVSGQPIQIGTNNISNINTFLIKYDPNGTCQWITYCQGGKNLGNTCVFNPFSSSVCIVGKYNSNLNAYDSDNFGLISATIIKDVMGLSSNAFLLNYNLNGIITWEARISPSATSTSADSQIEGLDLLVDSVGNLYLAGGFAPRCRLYSSDGSLNRILNGTLSGSKTAFLVKYYSNGIVQSAVQIATPGSLSTYSTSVNLDPLTNQVYLVGYFDGSIAVPTIIYNSDDTVSGASPLSTASPLSLQEAIFIVKYNPSSTPSFIVNPPNYNNPFDVQFIIGGSSRSLIEGYPADQTPEIWGGQTGFIASPIDAADLNAGVICSYGHELGNTRQFVAGLPSTSAKVYRCLSVTLSEPSFPTNDPQPETPGSVSYGLLPFYIQAPTYATGVVFNTQLYNSSNLIMSTTGPVMSGQSFGGLSIGDVIRIILIDPLSTGRYINLTVKGFIVSNEYVLPNIQAGVIFEESTYYVGTEITPSDLGLPRQTYTTLLPNNTISAYYQPRLIKEGKINLVLQLYNKYAP